MDVQDGEQSRDRAGAGAAIPVPAPDDAALTAALFALLDARDPGATVCPSEVARSCAARDASAWRALMPQVRRVAAGLAAQGRLKVTRRGAEVDALAGGGPIRLGRP